MTIGKDCFVPLSYAVGLPKAYSGTRNDGACMINWNCREGLLRPAIMHGSFTEGLVERDSQ